MKKVLFISQSAGRTGAPLMLLNLLQWLRTNSDLNFEILSRESGPLLGDFTAVAPTNLYTNQRDLRSLITRVSRQFGFSAFLNGWQQQQLLSRFRTSGISLVYSNTITNGGILKTLAPLGCPVITHVHELEHWIQKVGMQNLSQVKRHTSHYIAASQAAKQNLVERHALSSEKIDVVHSFIPIPKILPGPGVAARVRAELNIPSDAFVILGSGYEFWRKGKDLFVQLAAQLSKSLNGLQTHFLWVGGWQNPQHKKNILNDVRLFNLTGHIHFIGEVQNPLDYFAAGDVFSLVSREDTFPLVCLEAAALGKPVLCFADAGGMSEFVEGDAGFVVPYLDIEAMANRIIALAKDEKLRKQTGDRAAQKVRERHDIAVSSPKILQIIKQFI